MLSGTPARPSATLKTDFAVFRRLPLVKPYVQFSRIRLTVWKFVFIAPVPRTFSVSFHFGHDGIVQLGQAVCGSPHHLRIAPFDSPFGQYISYPHVLCLPFFTQRPFAPLLGHRFATRCRSGDTHGHCPLPRYYGLVRLLASLSLQRGLPSSLAELAGHAILLCPARALARRFAIAFGDQPSASLRRISFRLPKSIR